MIKFDILKKMLPYFFISSVLLTTSCSTSHFPWVYRIDVDQGNIIDTKKLDQLELGMSMRQVRYLLGSPLLQDTFHPNRWDYFYSYETGKGMISRKSLTLHFNEEQSLTRIDKKDMTSLKRRFY